MIHLVSWWILIAIPVLALIIVSVKRKLPEGQIFPGPFITGERFWKNDGRSRLDSFLIWIGIILLFIALSRPQAGYERLPEPGEGVDIVITLDVSGSMLADDYSPNRLEAAKEGALRFVDGRPNDRIGLVIYAGQALTLCPPTFDHVTLKRLISKAELGTLPDLTAIGSGLAIAARGLGYSRTKSRVIILLSDGMETSGLIDPLTVAEAIATLHGDSLRVYTVAVGEGTSTQAMMGYGVDRETLAKIALTTGGKLFDVNSTEELQQVYIAIDSLEKSTLPADGLFIFRDRHSGFLIVGFCFLIMGLILKWGIYKVVGD